MNKYVLVNGIILDGNKEMKPTKGKVIYVDDNKISDILDKTIPLKDGYEVIDLNNKYIMPGFINLHIHLAAKGGIPKKRNKPVDYKKLFNILTKSKLVKKYFIHMELKEAKDELYSGVTTLRAVGGILNFDGIVRDLINNNKAIGPKILSANTGISVPGGHFAGSLAIEANSPQEAKDYIEKAMIDKPDLIKLMITGGVMDSGKDGEPGVLRMPKEIVKASCEKAHEKGLMVAAHIESKEGVKVALENGVDTIEHGGPLDDYLINKFKETKASFVATLSPVIPYVFFDLNESNCLPVAKKNSQIVFEGMLDCINKALSNDIPIGLGTDTGCPFIQHYNTYREAYYFAKYAKVSNEFALYTLTLGNAKILKMDDLIGSISKGKIADMIVAKDNPLDDLRNLKNLDMVINKGMIINNPKIKKNKKIEALLDKYM